MIGARGGACGGSSGIGPGILMSGGRLRWIGQ